MKAFHLKAQREIKAPFCKEVAEMLAVEKEHSIELPLPNGVIGMGYILGEQVIAPFFYRESLVAKKDGHNIVLTYLGTSPWGVSYFNLPFPIICEPLHFRHEPLHTGTFLFKVSDNVQLCIGVNPSTKKGKFEVGVPADFCPVFDRHAHIIGFNVGMIDQRWLTIKIQELL